MGQVLLVLVIALTVAAVVFGVTVLVSGRDPGLAPAEPDGRAVPLPGARPLRESDVGEVRFDTALRGYRMAQVDEAMRRAAYDIGYKSELIGVLEAEVAALREGRTADADALRRVREEAAGTPSAVGDDTRDHDHPPVTPAGGATAPADRLGVERVPPVDGAPGSARDADDPGTPRDAVAAPAPDGTEPPRAAVGDTPLDTATRHADDAAPVDGRPGAVARSESA
ncbi:DivIVA domain-containing protein [Micromonospora sp. DT47]|uniref:DivIVA domain-containing protein n=1 Tax=Micromonospora sp. DT47 TaxID=3393431 RepID=UPI003CE8CDA0